MPEVEKTGDQRFKILNQGLRDLNITLFTISAGVAVIVSYAAKTDVTKVILVLSVAFAILAAISVLMVYLGYERIESSLVKPPQQRILEDLADAYRVKRANHGRVVSDIWLF